MQVFILQKLICNSLFMLNNHFGYGLEQYQWFGLHLWNDGKKII